MTAPQQQQLTSWTIAKGVCLGLILFGLILFGLGIVGGFLFASLGNSGTPKVNIPALTTEETTTTRPTIGSASGVAPLGFEGNAGSLEQCQAVFDQRAAAGVGKTQFVADCLTGGLRDAQVRP